MTVEDREPELTHDGGQVIEARDVGGQFVKGGHTLSTEEATRRARLAVGHKRTRKSTATELKVAAVARATLAVMPALDSPEAEEARRLLVEQYARLAVTERGSSAVAALGDLARRIGDSFQALTKLAAGDTCPRCKQVYGSLIPKVHLKPDVQWELFGLNLIDGFIKNGIMAEADEMKAITELRRIEPA